MATKNHAVIGTVASYSQADLAVDQLVKAGFARGDISALFPRSEETKAFALENNTKAPEGAAVGAAGGGVVGGAIGLLAGIGALAIPGLGPFIAAGPIVAALSGAGIGGAVGGLAGSLIGLGVTEVEAKNYEEKIKQGRYLVAVHVDTANERARAAKALKEAGAQDVSSVSEVVARA